MSPRFPLTPLGVALICAASARASSISNETGVGTSQTSPSYPRAGYLYDRLAASADLSDDFSLRVDGAVTHDSATPGQRGVRFADTGGNIFFASFGADWDVSDHISLSGEADYSPTSTQRADAPVSFDNNGTTTAADAQIRSTTGTYGFILQGGYQTTGESNWEVAADGTLSLTHYSTQQRLDALETSTGPESIQRVLDSCALDPRKSGCRAIAAAARQQSAEINQYQIAAAFTQTIHQDTDLVLGGSYYFYDHDPRQIGYFSIATVGRFTTNLGAGVPLAPLHFTLRPEVTQRLGSFQIEVWYQFGQYVPGEGTNHSAGLKFLYKFSRAWSAWVSGDGQLDLDSQGNSITSGSVIIGAKYRF